MRRLRRSFVALLAASMLGAAVGAVPVAAEDPAPSEVLLTVDDQGHFLQDNHPFALVASVSPADVDFATGATIGFVEIDGFGPPCEDIAVDIGNETSCQIADLGAGTYHYQATYSGNAALASSQSAVVEFVVAPDGVEAEGLGVSLGTFYPYKDGYRDTVAISGNRLEPISVTIRIYNADNRRVKLVTKALGSGRYSYAWNGRNKAGDILPAGKYRVVQTLVDAAGMHRNATHYVSLSKKRLVTRTAYVTKAGDRILASGLDGSGSLSHTTTGILILRAGTGYAAAGWQFRIPGAVIYKSIKFQVDAKSPLVAPPTIIAMQNFGRCARSSGAWYLECFDRFKDIGNSSGARRWYSTTGSVRWNRSGRYVRGAIWVEQGKVYVYRVRVKVTYQVLR